MAPSTCSSCWRSALPLLLIGALLPTGCATARVAPASTESELVDVGVARVDVTPREPIRLSGFGNRREPSDGVRQRIWARAIAFGSDRQGPAILITAGLVGIPGQVADSVADRLERRIGVPRDRIAIMATHTHGGPAMLGVLPNLFGEPVPPDQLLVIGEYTERLAVELERVAMEALAAREPARISWGRGSAPVCINRRNPPGPTDPDLPVMQISDATGEPRAVLVSYACHAVALGAQFNRIHGDWPAALAERLERDRPGTIALIAIGAGGDQRPDPRGSAEDLPPVVTRLASEIERVLAGPLRPLEGPPTGRFRTIDLPFQTVPTLTEMVAEAGVDGPRGYAARLWLDRLNRGEEMPATVAYPVQLWSFGGDLQMVFLAGESVAEYGLRLKREMGAEWTWVNSYANEAVGYVPSRVQMPESGYEVDGSRPYYDLPARLSDGVEDLIVHTVEQMAAQLGVPAGPTVR